MRREQLEHVLRAACRITSEDTALIIGSQAIHGSFPERVLPDVALRSTEVDVTFLNDSSDQKSGLVDGAIGEESAFHQTFGYYAQGVSVTTAVLPSGWRDRLVALETPGTYPGRGLCLDAHDLVVSKLVAHREKDLAFATALLRAGLVDAAVLHERIARLAVNGDLKQILHTWVDAATR